MKSINGPIDVVLLNKHSDSSVPVVLPVPPPEDILRSAKSAMFTSDKTDCSMTPCQASDNTKHSTKSTQMAMEDMQNLQSLSFINGKSNRTDVSGCEYFSLHIF